jgi:chromosomal replication initiation ATPase DnaA
MSDYITIEEDKLRSIKESLTGAMLLVDTMIRMEEDKRDKAFLNMNSKERVDHILNGASEYFHVTRENLTSPRRYGDIALRKKFLCLLLSKYAKITQDEIAFIIGYKERSSVSNAIDALEGFLAPSPFGVPDIKDKWQGLLAHLKIAHLKVY